MLRFPHHPPSGRNLFFDLSLRKDWKKLTPAVLKDIEDDDMQIVVEEDVLDVFAKEGLRAGDIEAVVFRYVMEEEEREGKKDSDRER